jgi:hypothetical protein
LGGRGEDILEIFEEKFPKTFECRIDEVTREQGESYREVF